MNAAGTQAIGRVLVVKLSSLGDILHVLPAVHSLKVITGATVDWAVQSEYAELVGCFEDVARVIPTQRRAFLRSLPPLWRALRSERYDLVVDLQGLLKSAIVTALARGGRRVGPSYHREGARLFYHAVAGPRNLARHAVEQAQDVIRFLEHTPLPPAFPMRLPAMTVPPAQRHVALLPVSRWPSKNWPVEHFTALARALAADAGTHLHLLGSAADAATCASIAAAVAPERLSNHAGRLSMVQLAGLLKRMQLLVANDSGPVHVAAAVGTPALALFGPTDATRTGPYGSGHRILRAPPPCTPCYNRTCRRHGEPCLARLEPAVVLAAARDMLAAGP